MKYAPGQHLIVGIEGTELTSQEHELFTKIQPGGFVLFSRNIETAQQVRALTDELRNLSHDFKPLISMDQEGGIVSRLLNLGVQSPSAQQLRECGDLRWVVWHAKLTGVILRTLGVNLNFAPVVDISYDDTASNSLKSRCFGSSPEQVLEYAGIYAGNLKSSGILTCAKHFPTVGRAKSDPHHDLPVVETDFNEIYQQDLLPYNALIGEIDTVMTAHVLYPELDPEHPASLSPRLVEGVLRDRIGFNGVAITDDLDMGAITQKYKRPDDVWRALMAGNDMAMICHDLKEAEAVYSLIDKQGYQNPEIFESSLKRIKRLKRKIKPPHELKSTTWDELVEETHELMRQMGVSQQTRGESLVTQI